MQPLVIALYTRSSCAFRLVDWSMAPLSGFMLLSIFHQLIVNQSVNQLLLNGIRYNEGCGKLIGNLLKQATSVITASEVSDAHPIVGL